jgi:hypothetical protein
MTATTTAPRWITDPATAPQLAYLAKLNAAVPTDSVPTDSVHVLDVLMDLMDGKPISKGEASDAITVLKPLAAAAAKPARQAPTTRAAAPAITDGMYLKDGVVYKVQVAVHGSGNLYAKRLEVEEALDADGQTVARGRFEYAPGVIRDLRPEHRMTLEQAKQFGALYGVCCRCGRTLTNEDSIEAAMGPICRGKF